VASERARNFFALWPNADVRAALAHAALAAQAECGGRATAAEKIHLTLFFIGEVERSLIPALEQCAARLEAHAFTLDMSRLGYWRHNRIVWAGSDACPPELAALASTLARNLAREGVQGEDRPYVPHVTLVRNARRAPVGRAVPVPSWPVRELVLVESAPAPRGSRYQVIARFPFPGA
jgi:2'-5' RNA ligase